MKKILMILALLGFTTTYAQECGRDNLSNNCSRAKIYTNRLETIAIKTAVFLSDRGLSTIEDFISLKVSKMDKAELEQFRKQFSTLFLDSSFKGFIRSAKDSSYWNKSRRLNNASASLAMILMKDEEPEFFQDREVKFIWSLQNLDFIENRILNEFNLSNIVVKLTGAVGDRESISRDSAQSILNSMEMAECLIDVTEGDDLYGDMLAYADEVKSDGPSISLKGEIILNRPFIKLPAHSGVRKIEVKDTRMKLRGGAQYKRNEIAGTKAVHEYFKTYDLNEYGIISKSDMKISLFQEGELLSEEVLSTELLNDDRRNIGGAGIYYIDNGNVLYNSDGSFFKELSDHIDLRDGSIVIILPSDKDSHDIKIKNHKLTFNSSNSKEYYSAYNYTGRDHLYIPISFKTTSQSKTNIEFAKALEDEKEKMMKIYGMDSDTYNELAKFSYGVMNVETQYGKSLKYKIKEAAPILVSIAKGNGLNVKKNSRGLTQMKKIPEAIVKAYGIDKTDLDEPRAAAIATVGFAYELLQDLKRISHNHKEINSSNIYDYLYYLYQGKRKEITRGSATPNLNLTIRKIEKAKQTITLSDLFN